MHPFLKIGDMIAIPTYGICLATGFLISLFIYHRLRPAREITNFSQTTLIAIFLLISGFSGAALLGSQLSHKGIELNSCAFHRNTSKKTDNSRQIVQGLLAGHYRIGRLTEF